MTVTGEQEQVQIERPAGITEMLQINRHQMQEKQAGQGESSKAVRRGPEAPLKEVMIDCT